MICGACIASPPPYNKARALMHHDQYSKPIITQLKYYDKTHFSKYIAQWLYQRFKSFIDASDVIIPVPLHSKRLRMRRYNQSALIAKYLTKKAENTQFIADALVRTKNAPPQTNLTYKQRIKNLHNSFECNKRHDISNKVILLIDDVITTGTTVSQCSKTLLDAGAKEVNVLALAKTCK
ncbi:MAG: ComF family protein [Rickettsiales bacterium]|nr:ComF family protein [Rickettsiales bacterium]